MIYIDESGMQIETPDLSRGYLVDHEWIDHPAQAQIGHYEYMEDEGARLQVYVVDTPAAPARREITAQKYIRYTEAELEAMNRPASVEARVAALEAAIINQ